MYFVDKIITTVGKCQIECLSVSDMYLTFREVTMLVKVARSYCINIC